MRGGPETENQDRREEDEAREGVAAGDPGGRRSGRGRPVRSSDRNAAREAREKAEGLFVDDGLFRLALEPDPLTFQYVKTEPQALPGRDSNQIIECGPTWALQHTKC